MNTKYVVCVKNKDYPASLEVRQNLSNPARY